MPSSQPVNTAFLDLMGPEASAFDFAEQLKKSKTVDFSKLLVDSDLQNGPQSSFVSADVFQLLDAERASAESAWRKCGFIFVDLTSREILPDWIAPGSVGSKLTMPGVETLSSTTLVEMASALKRVHLDIFAACSNGAAHGQDIHWLRWLQDI